MGNFEKLSVLVIVVIIVMILVVALYTWTDNPDHGSGGTAVAAAGTEQPAMPPTEIGKKEADNKGILTPQPPSPKPPETIPTIVDLLKKNGLDSQGQPAPTPSPVPMPPAPPPPAEPKTHVVQAGDTLGHIAKQYYPQSPVKGLAAIRAANPTVQDTTMRVGTKLIIPELSADPAGSGVAPANGTGPAPAPKPVIATIQRGGTYVVRKGDNLLKISRLAYGKEDRWQDIWLANFDAIDDVDHPAAGTRLKIPR